MPTTRRSAPACLLSQRVEGIRPNGLGAAVFGLVLLCLPACKIAQISDRTSSRAPKLILQVGPRYTEQALQRRLQGTVALSFLVDQNGRTRDIKVVKALDPGLDRNAIVAAEQWQFEPGTRNGRPIDVRTNAEVTFRLPSRLPSSRVE